jgi:hypothetical protein
MKKLSLLKAAAAIAVLTSVPAFSQALDSTAGASDVQLNATIGESLTVTLDVASVNFTLTPGSATNPGSTGINATTTWMLASGRSAVSLYAYFDTPTAALTAGASENIPSSAVSAAVSGTSVGAFSSAIAATGFTGTGVTIFTAPITSANLSGSQASPVTLNINLTGVSNLGAGTYTGTLHFRAEATT